MLLLTIVAAAVVAPVRLLLRPLPRIRDRVGAVSCHLWARALCPLFGIRLRVTGPVPKEAPFLVVANHLSYLDILVLAAAYPSLFVAKREIAHWPLFGWVVAAAGTLWVDRERPRDVVRAGVEMVRHFERGAGLTIFPEGFAGPGDVVRPFLPSLLQPAAACGVPCRAVALSYALGEDDGPVKDLVPWHDASHFVRHVVRLLRVGRIDADLRFSGEVVLSDDRKELARRLHRAVAERFVPLAPS